MNFGLTRAEIVTAMAAVGIFAYADGQNRAATRSADEIGPLADALSGSGNAGTFFGVLILAAGGLVACACIAVIFGTSRRRSAQISRAQTDPAGGAPGSPRRHHYLLLAILFTAVAIYGSLVPFGYRPLTIHDAAGRFREILFHWAGIGSRTDWVANALLFMPISYCWLAVCAVDRQLAGLRILTVPLVILLLASLSMALEFAQLWFPPRTVSQNDILAQTIGSLVGTMLWLGIGQTITDGVRSYTSCRRAKTQIDWLLQAYFIGLLIYSVLPLDVILSPTELVHKYRADKICLVPFSNMGTGPVFLYELFRDVVVFIPVGMLAATWLTSPQRPVRPISTSVLLGGLVVLTMELAQVLVYSRYTAADDVITGTFGVWLGAWAMRRWRGPDQQQQRQPASSSSARRAGVWLAMAGLYSLFLVVLFCAPFHVIHDPQQIKARYNGLFCVPFVRFYELSEFHALSEVLQRVLFCAPLGALFAMAVAQLSVPQPIRRIMLAVLLMVAAGIAASIEMAQVFLSLPSQQVPDITDVLLCTIGAAMGMFVTAQIVPPGRSKR